MVSVRKKKKKRGATLHVFCDWVLNFNTSTNQIAPILSSIEKGIIATTREVNLVFEQVVRDLRLFVTGFHFIGAGTQDARLHSVYIRVKMPFCQRF